MQLTKYLIGRIVEIHPPLCEDEYLLVLYDIAIAIDERFDDLRLGCGGLDSQRLFKNSFYFRVADLPYSPCLTQLRMVTKMGPYKRGA